MTEFDELSDDEILNRLLNRNVDAVRALDLVDRRDDPEVAERIEELLS